MEAAQDALLCAYKFLRFSPLSFAFDSYSLLTSTTDGDNVFLGSSRTGDGRSSHQRSADSVPKAVRHWEREL